MSDRDDLLDGARANARIHRKTTMIRTKNKLLKSIAITMSSVLPAIVLAGCTMEDGGATGPEEVSESAAELGIEVNSCSKAANSGFVVGTSTLSLSMTAPNVVIGVVTGYITVNGYPCVKKTADGGGKLTPAMVKKIVITGTGADEKVVVDSLSGSFGSTILSNTGGITVDLAGGTGDSFSLRGSSGADKYSAGDSGGATYFEISGDTTADIKVSGAEAFNISTSGGNDVFAATGGAITGSHFGGVVTTLTAVAADLTVNGGDGDDTITGGAGDDTLNGNAGKDTFKTASSADGDDVYSGGSEVDKMDYTGRTATLTVVMDGSTNSGEGSEADLVGSDIEDLTGGSGDDSLTGNALANYIRGGAGNDTIDGGPAGTCSADVDVLDGEAGDDVFDMLATSDCGDTLNGGAGTDRADYQLRTNALTILVDGNANDGESGEKDNIKNDVEIILGGDGNDTITGSANGDEIHGGPGDDTIYGGAGNDILTGNSGDDKLNGDTGDDTFAESGIDAEYASGTEEKGDGNDIINGGTNSGSGLDTLDYSSRTADLTVTICTDPTKLTLNSALVTAQCTDSDGDSATSEADKIVNVTHVMGGAGDDTIKGHTADDTLQGGAGADDLYGGAGSDTLFGDDGDDNLFGEAGDDTLDGVAGDDTFDGGAGDGDICVIEANDTSDTGCEL